MAPKLSTDSLRLESAPKSTSQTNIGKLCQRLAVEQGSMHVCFREITRLPWISLRLCMCIMMFAWSSPFSALQCFGTFTPEILDRNIASALHAYHMPNGTARCTSPGGWMPHIVVCQRWLRGTFPPDMEPAQVVKLLMPPSWVYGICIQVRNSLLDKHSFTTHLVYMHTHSQNIRYMDVEPTRTVCPRQHWLGYSFCLKEYVIARH